MRIVLLTLILLNAGQLNAQISNSWSSDKTGIYYYSIDSLIKIINKEKTLDRVFITTEHLTRNHQELPDTIAGVKIIKTDKKIKPKSLTNKDILINNLDIQLNQGKVVIIMIVYRKADNQLQYLETVDFIFSYKLESDSQTYKLVSVDKVPINVHLYK